MTRIGLLSDTHGYFDPAIEKNFAHCDEIWHAGYSGAVVVAGGVVPVAGVVVSAAVAVAAVVVVAEVVVVKRF